MAGNYFKTYVLGSKWSVLVAILMGKLERRDAIIVHEEEKGKTRSRVIFATAFLVNE